MTEDTTTIEITESQKEWLDEFKASGQSYKGALDTLIEIYGQREFESIDLYKSGSDEPVDQVPDLRDELTVNESEIARQVTDDLVSQLPPKIADELEGR